MPQTNDHAVLDALKGARTRPIEYHKLAAGDRTGETTSTATVRKGSTTERLTVTLIGQPEDLTKIKELLTLLQKANSNNLRASFAKGSF